MGHINVYLCIVYVIFFQVSQLLVSRCNPILHTCIYYPNNTTYHAIANTHLLLQLHSFPMILSVWYMILVWWESCTSVLYGKTCSNGSHTLFRKVQSDRKTLAGNIRIVKSSITSDACYAILTLVPVSHYENSYYKIT